MAQELENYYELMEISETASQEVIERVYKLLAKKYHPDLNPDNPKAAEEKFKKISVAYDTLSNETKRKAYDEKLRLQRERASSSSMTNSPRTTTSTGYSGTARNNLTREQQEALYKKQLEYLRQQKQQAYNDAYREALERMGYTVVDKKSPKEIFNTILGMFFTFLVIAIVFFIMWHIPASHDKMVELYEESGPIRFFIDLFIGNS